MDSRVPISRVEEARPIAKPNPDWRPRIPSISVVIPTFNRGEDLCQTVREILRVSYPDRELVIVDQTPKHTPETAAFLSELPPKVRGVVLPQPNIPVARNVGAMEAQGEIVLYLDDYVTLFRICWEPMRGITMTPQLEASLAGCSLQPVRYGRWIRGTITQQSHGCTSGLTRTGPCGTWKGRWACCSFR